MYVACVRDDVACVRGDVASEKGDADARKGRQEGGMKRGEGKEGRREQREEVQWRWTGGTHPFTRVSLLETRDEAHLPLLHHLTLLLLSPPPLSTPPTTTNKSKASSGTTTIISNSSSRNNSSDSGSASSSSNRDSSSSSSDRALFFSSLLPFLCRALLPAPSPPSRLRFKATLHTRLVQVAATSADLFQPITALLVSLLPWHMLSSAAVSGGVSGIGRGSLSGSALDGDMTACELMDLAYAMSSSTESQQTQHQIPQSNQPQQSHHSHHPHSLPSLATRLSACALALSLELQAAGTTTAAGASSAAAAAPTAAASAAAGLPSCLFLVQKASLLRARIECQREEGESEKEDVGRREREDSSMGVGQLGGVGGMRRMGRERGESEEAEQQRVEEGDAVEVVGLLRLLLCGLPADEDHIAVLAVLQYTLAKLNREAAQAAESSGHKGTRGGGGTQSAAPLLLLLPLLHLLSFPSPALKQDAARAMNACLAVTATATATATATQPFLSSSLSPSAGSASSKHAASDQQQLWHMRQQQQQWRHADLWHTRQYAHLFTCLTSSQPHTFSSRYPVAIASAQRQRGTWHSPETWANEPVPRQHDLAGSSPSADVDDELADVAKSLELSDGRSMLAGAPGGVHGCHVSGSNRWLLALQQQLNQIRKETVRKAGRETSAGSGMSQSLILSLAALLLPLSTLHPSPSLRSSSLLSLSRLASCEPIWALSLLPAVLWSLSHVAQGGVGGEGEVGGERGVKEGGGRGSGDAGGKSCLQVLCVLPSLARHWLAAGPVVQVLTKLAGQKSRPLLASVALRLLQQAWAITDRIFPSLQPLLLPPSLSLPKSIRKTNTSSTASGDVGGGEVMVLAAAASIRGVCRHDTDRAVRLVLSVQAAIESPSPLVAALGLDALAALCAADAVDFFTAWKVVARSHPSLPAHPITAARWCHLLQSAALDAAAYPDATRGIMEGLWEASRKGREGELIGGGERGEGEREWRPTRAAAFTALAAFSLDDVTATWPYPSSTHLVQAFLSVWMTWQPHGPTPAPTWFEPSSQSPLLPCGKPCSPCLPNWLTINTGPDPGVGGLWWWEEEREQRVTWRLLPRQPVRLVPPRGGRTSSWQRCPGCCVRRASAAAREKMEL
ncbi:unnamed protein product, partial [Closterium sp. NIES-53]